MLCVVLVSLSLFGGPTTGRLVAAGAILVSVAFATVLVLGWSWQREREESALDGPLVAPIDKSALFVGKALSILGFLFAIEVVGHSARSALLSSILSYGPGVVAIRPRRDARIAATGTLFGSMTCGRRHAISCRRRVVSAARADPAHRGRSRARALRGFAAR